MDNAVSSVLSDNECSIKEGARLNDYDVPRYKRILERAMWAGDVELLDEIAHCRCCCGEHTFYDCPARAWYGCRGTGTETQHHADWYEHYRRFHGMDYETFYGQPRLPWSSET
jgi:hypothetical protein